MTSHIPESTLNSLTQGVDEVKLDDALPPIVNEMPTIAIYMHPMQATPVPEKEGIPFVMGAYIKFVEMAGAIPIPLYSTMSEEEQKAVMNKTNGLILGGGRIPLVDEHGNVTEFLKHSKFVYDYAKKLNDSGVYYPVLGVCLGHQQLFLFEAPYSDVLELEAFDDHNNPTKVNFNIRPSESKFYREFPEDIINLMQTSDLVFMSHHDGVGPETFDKHEELRDAFIINATTVDRQGRQVVASIEHRNYPFFGIQFHPEKPTNIFCPKVHVRHTLDSSRLAQAFSNYFVTHARRNTQHFPNGWGDIQKHLFMHIEHYFHNSTLQDLYFAPEAYYL